MPAGTRLPAHASTTLPRAKGAPGHCQKSVGRRARGWHCCGLHGARLGLLQHPRVLLEVGERCVTISAPSLRARRGWCPGIPPHQGPENSSPHPVGPHRPGREEKIPATRLLAGQGDEKWEGGRAPVLPAEQQRLEEGLPGFMGLPVFVLPSNSSRDLKGLLLGTCSGNTQELVQKLPSCISSPLGQSRSNFPAFQSGMQI